jgi:hypothetical protein
MLTCPLAYFESLELPGGLPFGLRVCRRAFRTEKAFFTVNCIPASVLPCERERFYTLQVEVASELRSLLEGSTLVNPRKGGVNTPAVSAIPQYHGPLRVAVKSASSAIKVELGSGGGSAEGTSASAESSKGDGKTDGVEYIPSPLVASCVSALLLALGPVVGISVKRLSLMVEALEGLAVSEGSGRSRESEGLGALVLRAQVELASLKAAASGAAEELLGADMAGDDSTDIPRVKVAGDALSSVRSARGILAAEAFLAGKLLKAKETALASKVGGKGGKEEGQKVPPSKDQKAKEKTKGADGAAKAGGKETGLELAVTAVSLDGPLGGEKKTVAREAVKEAKGNDKQKTTNQGAEPSTSGVSDPEPVDSKAATGGRERGKGRTPKPENGQPTSEQGGVERGRGRGGAKASEKAEKKAKKGGVALGKGTALVKEFVDGMLALQGGDDRAVLAAITAALDPLNKELGALVGKVKESLESNAARRKPKIAKVSGAKDWKLKGYLVWIGNVLVA